MFTISKKYCCRKMDGNKIFDVSELFRCYFDVILIFFLCFFSMFSLSFPVFDYTPALKKWGVYWFTSVCGSVRPSVIRNTFSSKISPQPFKIETSNLIYRFTTASCIVGLKMGLPLFVLPCIYSFFFLSRFFVKDISATV